MTWTSFALGVPLASLLALTARAEDARPAPDYFFDTVMATTTAQQLALACSTLSFDIHTASIDSGAALTRLREDGFDPGALETEMQDPAPLFAVRQADFMAKHGLSEGVAEDLVCAAGQAEIAEGSTIGKYLTEVTE